MDFDFETVQSAFGMAGKASESVSKLVTSVATIRKLIGNSEAGGDPDIKAALIEFADQLAEAKLANIDLKSELHDLLVQAQELKRIEDKLARYELHERENGIFVLRLKEDEQSNEPPHSICQKCVNEKKHVVLQSQYKGFGGYHLVCPECDTDYGVLRTEPYAL